MNKYSVKLGAFKRNEYYLYLLSSEEKYKIPNHLLFEKLSDSRVGLGCCDNDGNPFTISATKDLELMREESIETDNKYWREDSILFYSPSNPKKLITEGGLFRNFDKRLTEKGIRSVVSALYVSYFDFNSTLPQLVETIDNVDFDILNFIKRGITDYLGYPKFDLSDPTFVSTLDKKCLRSLDMGVYVYLVGLLYLNS